CYKQVSNIPLCFPSLYALFLDGSTNSKALAIPHLLRIAQAYPNPPTAMLELLENSIEEVQATIPAVEATINTD
ncbi:MAG: hypothetical protein MUD14_14405, partial [Hydrococcus sp. Prado102]|nr:hypothetical protein [Hydrococcus sp. Prado102]